MIFSFDPDAPLIVVPVRLYGPKGRTIARLAFDTGATATLVNTEIAVFLGYDPASVETRKHITTGSGVEFAAQVILEKVKALGQEINHFPVVCHTLPPSAGVDGLLGLDFMRGKQVVLDFRTGRISVA